MSTPKTTDQVPASKSSQFWQKAANWAYIVLAVILTLIGFMRIYDWLFPSLPRCASDTATTTIGQIFKAKNLELSSLTNQKALTDSSSERTCQAEFTTPTETGTLEYRIYWQDKSAQIQITKADSHPR